MRNTNYATAAESAKLLKAALKKAFPATKFSVTLSRGTAYGCAYVKWTDGPTPARVEAVYRSYQGEGFDGMTDSSYHIDTTMSDGRASGLRLINHSRTISPAFAALMIPFIAQYWGFERVPTVVEAAWGGYQLVGENDIEAMAKTGNYWSTLIHRAAHDRTSVVRK